MDEVRIATIDTSSMMMVVIVIVISSSMTHILHSMIMIISMTVLLLLLLMLGTRNFTFDRETQFIDIGHLLLFHHHLLSFIVRVRMSMSTSNVKHNSTNQIDDDTRASDGQKVDVHLDLLRMHKARHGFQ